MNNGLLLHFWFGLFVNCEDISCGFLKNMIPIYLGLRMVVWWALMGGVFFLLLFLWWWWFFEFVYWVAYKMSTLFTYHVSIYYNWIGTSSNMYIFWLDIVLFFLVFDRGGFETLIKNLLYQWEHWASKGGGLWDSILVGEENEALFTRVWKLPPNEHVLETLRGSLRRKVQTRQYLLVVSLCCYKL